MVRCTSEIERTDASGSLLTHARPQAKVSSLTELDLAPACGQLTLHSGLFILLICRQSCSSCPTH